ncbi:MAG: hypothetical protein K8L91_15410 [Anaerolineae bacterium]|nr:hypothetical protein [Anaerolineae bacterium]
MTKIQWLARMIVVAVTCGVMVSFIGPLAAQDNERQPIHEGAVGDLSWSSDSQFVSFFDAFGANPSVHLDELSVRSWQKYDPVTGILTASKTWPQQPMLTDDEQDFFRPTDLPDGSTTYIFESPNKHHLVYCSPIQASPSLLILGNRAGMELLGLDDVINNPFIGPHSFRVIWSADSSAFVTIDERQPAVLRYVTNFDTWLRSTQVTRLHKRDFRAWDVFDLSDDGNLVLVLGDTVEIRQQLMVVNPLNLSENIVLQTPDASEITAAIFAPDNANQILFVSEQGLGLYDMESQRVSILDSSITAELGVPIAFSPDGRWLAYQSLEGLFVIPMSDYLEE